MIGALHFSPMIGYQGYSSYDCILNKAKIDLEAFEKGGIDAVILENNYNFPHQPTKETNEAVEMMTSLVKDLVRNSNLPFGISVLFNDYKSALKIAQETGGKFVRVPAFVDSIRTIFGEIYAEPEKVIETRRNLCAQDIKIYADIQVKHAEMLDPSKTIEQSTLEAVARSADGLIITGKITGDPPKIDDLKRSKKYNLSLPIIIGSGADKDNIRELFDYSDAVILSTSLKESNQMEGERNIKPFEYKIDEIKVREFVDLVNRIQERPFITPGFW